MLAEEDGEVRMSYIITLLLLIAGLAAAGLVNYRWTLCAARKLVDECRHD